MKRVLVLFLGLMVLGVGGGLFAIDIPDIGLSINGGVGSGLQLEKVDENDMTAKAYSDAYGDTFRAWVTTKYELENVGASVRLRTRLNNEQGIIDHAFGWAKLFGDKLELSAGMLDNNKWGANTAVGDFNLDKTLDNQGGIKILVAPFEGFTFGITTFDVQGDKVEKSLTPTVIGLRYNNDSLLDVALSVRFDVRNKNAPDASKQYLELDHKYFEGLLGLNVKAVENLTLLFETWFWSITQDADKDPTVNALDIALRGMYAINNLSLGAQFNFNTDGSFTDGNGTGTMAFKITPKVSYSITEAIKVGLDVPLTVLDTKTDIGDSEANKDYKSGFTFGIKPKVGFDLGNGASIDLFYLFKSAKDGYPDGGSSKAVPSHTIQLDFVWTF
ncbi:MAG: hypothetical protein LBD20_05355 [Spirochaetaceae bacterium]|nr:hypothetical protein [Spirochaetaceae bacterium]